MHLEARRLKRHVHARVRKDLLREGRLPREMHHLFCTKCGIHAFGTYAADGQEKVIVNLRCLEGIDPDKLKVQTFDGKSYR